MYVPPLPANLDELKQRITTALQTATQDSCSVFGRSWSIELACDVYQAERILNIYEIGYEIHISLNFLFIFGVKMLIMFNIKPV